MVSTGDLDWFIGSRSAAGVEVTPNGALASTTVMACVNLIARSLASVPLVLYRKTEDGAEPALEHPLYRLLHDQANRLQTAMEVRETMFANALLYGNAYAEIDWGQDGWPVALWPMAAERVGLEISKDKTLTYTYLGDDGRIQRLPEWSVLHLRGLAMTGLLGISPIRAAMNAVGLALATEQFGGRYFSDGAAPSMVLSHPAKLTPEAMRNLRTSFENQWSGLNRSPGGGAGGRRQAGIVRHPRRRGAVPGDAGVSGSRNLPYLQRVAGAGWGRRDADLRQRRAGHDPFPRVDARAMGRGARETH